MNNRFAALGIRQELVDLLQNNGIVAPTPVQEQAIPALIAGEDAIVQAQTGTGKTLAFVLPIMELIKPEKAAVQALILTPTRELAIQITAEAKKLAGPIGAGVLAVYGGQDVAAQVHKLKGGTHIVVATPGRLLDHLRRETLHLGHISMLVLDEADQMLTMGFLGEVEDIIRQCATQRQTMLFSATMPGPVKQLAANYMKRPVDIRIKTERVTLDDIHQFAVETTDRARQALLFRLIETYRPYLAVVFCRTKIRAKKLNEALLANGFASDELHGDLTQAKRELVMRRFREAKLQVLVATDVAARGLDVEGVTHVFNYDLPVDTETYIHRIGRTGRAGQQGTAVTLLAPKDRTAFAKIEQGIGQRLPRRRMEEFGVGASALPGFDAVADGDDRGGRQPRRADKAYGYAGSRPRGRTGKATPNEAGRQGGAYVKAEAGRPGAASKTGSRPSSGRLGAGKPGAGRAGTAGRPGTGKAGAGSRSRTGKLGGSKPGANRSGTAKSGAGKPGGRAFGGQDRRSRGARSR